MSRGARLHRVALVCLLASPACIDFSVDRYCAERPSLCEVSLRSVDPEVGPMSGGTVVTAVGLAFEEDTAVEVDGVPVPTVEFLSATTVRFTMPPHPAGSVEVRVRSRGAEAVLQDAFRYAAIPTITGLSPEVVRSAGGDTVTIRGSDFEPPVRVLVNDVSATVVSSSNTELIVIAPPGNPGMATVKIINDFESAIAEEAFLYELAWLDRSAGLVAQQPIRRLVVDPTRADHAFAVQAEQLFRTTDGGVTWAPISQLSGARDVVFAPSQPSRVYVATALGLFRSDDSGDTWMQAGPATSSHSVAVDPEDEERLLVGGEGEVRFSGNGGTDQSAEALPVEGPVSAVCLPPALTDSWLAGVGVSLLSRSAAIPWSVYRGSPGNAVLRLTWEKATGLLAIEAQMRSSISSTLGDRDDATYLGDALSVVPSGSSAVVYAAYRRSPTEGIVRRCPLREGPCIDLDQGFVSAPVSALAVAPSDPGVVYAGSSTGRVQRTSFADR